MNNSLTTQIRIANENDAHAIASIHVASWKKIYRGHISDTFLDNLSIKESEQRWVRFIKNDARVMVIELNNHIVGFACIQPSRYKDADPTKCGEINAIYLHPDFWRKGLGRKLCNQAFTELESMGFNEVTLWVLRENKQAIKFYESMGFMNTGITDAYKYKDEIILNVIRYRKLLPKSQDQISSEN